MRSDRRHALLLGAIAVSFAACDGGTGAMGTPSPDMAAPVAAMQQAVEWTGYHGETPLDPTQFHALAAGLFGADAQAGKFGAPFEINKGVFVTASAETATPDQARLTVAFDDGGKTPRVVAVAPTSFKMGELYIGVVDAAIAKMQADNAMVPGSGESWNLQYRVTSTQGGTLTFGVVGDHGKYTLVVDVTSAHTSLDPTKIGMPSDAPAAYDTVWGDVDFHLTKDDFDFFVDHAYGQGATGRQNFNDFELDPHDWLRLTVTPHLDQKFVNVAFVVVLTDGTRIPVAQAPASILAGDAFHSMVDRAMATTLQQEQAKPGSSTHWMVPFYYDQPSGGGVVQVIAQGTAGIFSIAYAVETPRHPLVDVPFTPYKDVTFPPENPNDNKSCDQLGDPNIKLAMQGTFDITFTASSVITSDMSHPPLQGTIMCSVFQARDVTVSGPKPDAVSLQDFNVPNADLSTGAMAPTFTTKMLYDGDYQILCGQDINADGKVDKGDPVTLPIGSYPIACNINPVTVEFSILDPQD